MIENKISHNILLSLRFKQHTNNDDKYMYKLGNKWRMDYDIKEKELSVFEIKDGKRGIIKSFPTDNNLLLFMERLRDCYELMLPLEQVINE